MRCFGTATVPLHCDVAPAGGNLCPHPWLDQTPCLCPSSLRELDGRRLTCCVENEATALTVGVDLATTAQHLGEILVETPFATWHHPKQQKYKTTNPRQRKLELGLSQNGLSQNGYGLYTSRIRESEKLETALELYDLEIHQKKLGHGFHRMKNMVKRSIEQEIRNNNFRTRSGNLEKNALVKNQGTKQRVQRILGDCWQCETNGQCVKGDNCSFHHDNNKRGKGSPSNPSPNSFTQQSERKPSRTRSPRGKSPSGRTSRWPCKDHLRGTCNNSFCERWHPPECLFYKNKNGCRFGEKCSFAHRQVDAQPTKRSKKQ